MANAEAVDPIVLGIRLSEGREVTEADIEPAEIPEFISAAFPDGLQCGGGAKRIYITLGQFSIIRLERDTQLLMPAYDYCLPEKECSDPAGDDPCELFRRISFPVDEFFPPDTVAGINEYREAVGSTVSDSRT
ncbi:MAG: hypothetical protein J5827_04840 [Oscillospiraceae bacterium]|nr:hypothetical protein [Oscillospiraceae bacterium]